MILAGARLRAGRFSCIERGALGARDAQINATNGKQGMSENLFADVRMQVMDIVERLCPGLAPETAARVEVTPAREAAHGDMATNAAMVVARAVRRPPAELARDIAAALRDLPNIESAAEAGPGFVNIRLPVATLQSQVAAILRAGETFGTSNIGQGVAVNVEYVSANPTGPLHIGHCRGAVVGDAIANVLSRCGYAVTKEFYVNDSGAQVIALAWAVYWRYLQALGTSLSEDAFAAEVPGGLQYRGEYLVPVGAALAAEYGSTLAAPGGAIAPPAQWLDTVRDFAIGCMLAAIREDLAALGVVQDVFTSEHAVLQSGAVDRTIETLRANNLIYEGVLEPPRGKTPEDWEPRAQTLFRSTCLGDDVDRPLRKSDGSNTYFANDIAYHADKMARGADLMIDVWGADHGGYVSRMQAAVRALADRGQTLQIVICQIVHVLRGGVPVRMSKRAGSFVTLRDLIDEVGRDAVRFTMLTRKPDAQMEFDLALVVAQTRDNPVFYVQYAHARCRSVLRLAESQGGAEAVAPATLAGADLASLTDEAELAVIRRMMQWPRTLQGAALAREPHRIAFFLYDLAADFHMLWNRGRDDSALRFIQESEPVRTRAKLAVVAAVACVIRAGLSVLGVTPVEEMR
jgi:arginyl-tRNA synthetase